VKGIVFTEFMEMVEAQFSADMVDDIIDDAAPPSGAAYTAVGTYDHAELVSLVAALSARTGVPVPDLILAFGRHMFGRFHAGYPGFFEGITGAVQFLTGIEDVIHAEVLKLYPDAQLPRFDCTPLDNGGLQMVYRSPRHFDDLAQGLIEGAVAHWGGGYTIERQPQADGTRFLIRQA
jgi:hypothetical protein